MTDDNGLGVNITERTVYSATGQSSSGPQSVHLYEDCYYVPDGHRVHEPGVPGPIRHKLCKNCKRRYKKHSDDHDREVGDGFDTEQRAQRAQGDTAAGGGD